MIQHLWDVKCATNSMTSPFQQVICEEFFRRGHFAKHNQEINEIYRKRCAAICEAVDKYFPEKTTRTNPEGGLFIWVSLPEELDTTTLQLEAKTRDDVKVVYVTGEESFIYGPNDKRIKNTLRLAFGAASEEQIDEGCKRLGNFFKEKLGEVK